MTQATLQNNTHILDCAQSAVLRSIRYCEYLASHPTDKTIRDAAVMAIIQAAACFEALPKKVQSFLSGANLHALTEEAYKFSNTDFDPASGHIIGFSKMYVHGLMPIIFDAYRRVERDFKLIHTPKKLGLPSPISMQVWEHAANPKEIVQTLADASARFFTYATSTAFPSEYSTLNGDAALKNAQDIVTTHLLLKSNFPQITKHRSYPFCDLETLQKAIQDTVEPDIGSVLQFAAKASSILPSMAQLVQSDELGQRPRHVSKKSLRTLAA